MATLFRLQWTFTPRLYLTARTLVNRALDRPVPGFRDPGPLGQPRPSHIPVESIKSPQDFLKVIGRSLETKISEQDWEKFWRTDSTALRKAGLAVRDRKYILWCMEKYRQGFPIKEFAHEPRPKKVVRGWGPKVQNGKRIRSRRLKDKKK